MGPEARRASKIILAHLLHWGDILSRDWTLEAAAAKASKAYKYGNMTVKLNKGINKCDILCIHEENRTLSRFWEDRPISDKNTVD